MNGIDDLAARLSRISGVKAVVLGGSRATGTQDLDSDIDLGLYYHADEPLDTKQLTALCETLNDIPRPTVTSIGEWGKWVNGGAWLTINGQRVDLLYRELGFVSDIILKSYEGWKESDYYQQPPYGFHSYIYCAETEACKVLFDPEHLIDLLKARVEIYPSALKKSIINSFLWDAEFTLAQCKKASVRAQVYFAAGCFTRIASDLVQVLYALNETYFMSEKRFYAQVDLFSVKPNSILPRLHQLLGQIGISSQSLAAAVANGEGLISDFRRLATGIYTPKFP
jgi:hypothetical protein